MLKKRANVSTTARPWQCAPMVWRAAVAWLTRLHRTVLYDGHHMYAVRHPFRSEFVSIRGLDYHVQHWPTAGPPKPALAPLVLLHGWMDVAASYQFMVDAFSDTFLAGRTIIAPDTAWAAMSSCCMPACAPRAYARWSI